MVLGDMQMEHSPIALSERLDENLRNAFNYNSISISIGTRPVGFRFFQNIINISAKLDEMDLIVTGEADSLEVAIAKAKSELIERSAIVSLPLNPSIKNSNGWAGHPNLVQAKINAINELVERDAVLSHWYACIPFQKIQDSDLPLNIQLWVKDELFRSELCHLTVLLSTAGIGPSVTCILSNEKGFGVSGHATREVLTNAIESAIAEACRAAHAYLRHEHWNDTLKLKNGELGKVQPGAHALYYAYHEPFPSWIFGSEVNLSQAIQDWNERISILSKNISTFSFQTVLESPIFVGFAKHPRSFDLQWGTTSENEVLNSAGAKRMGLNSVNKQAHIVA